MNSRTWHAPLCCLQKDKIYPDRNNENETFVHLMTFNFKTSFMGLQNLVIYPNLERFVVYNHIDYHFRDLASLHLTLSNTNHLFRLILISVSLMHLTSFWATMINMPRRQDFSFVDLFPCSWHWPMANTTYVE